MLDSHPEDGKEVPFRGSMIIYTGETAEEIRGLIEEDVYAKSGVWDIDNAQIIPVCLVFLFMLFVFFFFCIPMPLTYFPVVCFGSA